MKYRFTLLPFLAVLFSWPALAEEWQFGVAIYSDSYSEAMPIDQWVHDLEGELPNEGEEAYSFNRWSLEAKKGPWTVSLEQRLAYHISHSEDALELVHRDKNDLPIPENRVYDIHIDVLQYQSRGVNITRQFQLKPNLNVTAGLSYFHADGLIDGSINGVIATSDSDYAGELNVDYFYDEDYLLDRQVSSPTGHGYGLDLGFDWQINEGNSLSYFSKDAFAEILWSDAPYTRARLTSDTVNYNPDGSLNVSPRLSGIESNKRFRQRLPTSHTLRLRSRIDERHQWISSVQRRGQVDIFRFSLEQKRSDNFSVSASYEPLVGAVGLGLRYKAYTFAITTDDKDWEDMQRLALSASAYIRF